MDDVKNSLPTYLGLSCFKWEEERKGGKKQKQFVQKYRNDIYLQRGSCDEIYAYIYVLFVLYFILFNNLNIIGTAAMNDNNGRYDHSLVLKNISNNDHTLCSKF